MESVDKNLLMLMESSQGLGVQVQGSRFRIG